MKSKDIEEKVKKEMRIAHPVQVASSKYPNHESSIVYIQFSEIIKSTETFLFSQSTHSSL